jgi:hypothetical protein
MSRSRQSQRQSAGFAACTLQGLLRDLSLVQLLQQPPPVDLNSQQLKLLGNCCVALKDLEEFLPESVGSGTAVQQLSAVLRHVAAPSAAVLMAWVQQRPELLQPEAFYTSMQIKVLWVSVTAVWVMGRRFLEKLAFAVHRVTSSSAAALAAEMTQQLGRSGGLRMQLSQHCANGKAQAMLHLALICLLVSSVMTCMLPTSCGGVKCLLHVYCMHLCCSCMLRCAMQEY